MCGTSKLVYLFIQVAVAVHTVYVYVYMSLLLGLKFCQISLALLTLQECSKPQEAYGFEQAKTQYTLREFGFMADKFKEEYFGVSAHVRICT